jgi:hypothetical protein
MERDEIGINKITDRTTLAWHNHSLPERNTAAADDRAIIT